jgi:hypothetical protein
MATNERIVRMITPEQGQASHTSSGRLGGQSLRHIRRAATSAAISMPKRTGCVFCSQSRTIRARNPSMAVIPGRKKRPTGTLDTNKSVFWFNSRQHVF